MLEERHTRWVDCATASTQQHYDPVHFRSSSQLWNHGESRRIRKEHWGKEILQTNFVAGVQFKWMFSAWLRVSVLGDCLRISVFCIFWVLGSLRTINLSFANTVFLNFFVLNNDSIIYVQILNNKYWEFCTLYLLLISSFYVWFGFYSVLHVVNMLWAGLCSLQALELIKPVGYKKLRILQFTVEFSQYSITIRTTKVIVYYLH